MRQFDYELSAYQYSIAQVVRGLRRIDCAQDAVKILQMAVVELELLILEVDQSTLSVRLRSPEEPVSQQFLDYISYPAIVERLENEQPTVEID